MDQPNTGTVYCIHTEAQCQNVQKYCIYYSQAARDIKSSPMDPNIKYQVLKQNKKQSQKFKQLSASEVKRNRVPVSNF